MDSDPLFTYPSLGYGNQPDALTADWTVQLNSPVINAGTPDTTGLNLPPFDINGNLWSIEDAISIGPSSKGIIKETTVRLIQHPVSQTKCEGDDVLFVLEAIGSNLTYQWKKNGVDMMGETGDSLQLYNITPADAARYKCYVSNSKFAVYSNTAILRVEPLPDNRLIINDTSIYKGDTALLILQNTSKNTIYQLRLESDNSLVGPPSTGIGNPIYFEVSPLDTTRYNVFISHKITGCQTELQLKPTVKVIHHPSKPDTPTGPVNACEASLNIVYTTKGAKNATSYNWYITPPIAGTITNNGITSEFNWNNDWSGKAFVTVNGKNDYGNGPISDTLEVVINPLPEVQEINSVSSVIFR